MIHNILNEAKWCLQLINNQISANWMTAQLSNMSKKSNTSAHLQLPWRLWVTVGAPREWETDVMWNVSDVFRCAWWILLILPDDTPASVSLMCYASHLVMLLVPPVIKCLLSPLSLTGYETLRNSLQEAGKSWIIRCFVNFSNSEVSFLFIILLRLPFLCLRPF